MDSSINREVCDSRSIVASLPARHPLAQGIALALALGMGSAQAAVFDVTTNADSGPGTLRQAVLDANANPGADQITFSDGLGAIALTSGQIDITETLTITGPAAGQTIDAGGNSRIFGVTVAGQPLTLENLTLSGGRTGAQGSYPATCADDTGEGGGVCAAGDVTLTNSTVSDNSSTEGVVGARGGGLCVEGNSTLTNSTVSGNNSLSYLESGAGGGGLWVGGDARLSDTTVSDNGAGSGGGGLSVGGNATLTNSTVSGNGAGIGGGLLVDGNATLTNSTVSGNSTSAFFSDGGGLFVGGDATLTNSTVSGNHLGGGATGDGGGLHVRGNATLTNSTVSGNFASGDYSSGGGLYVRGDARLSNTTVSNNGTEGIPFSSGGGLYVGGNSTLTNCTVSGNSALHGFAGGLFVGGNSTLTNCTVSGNSAVFGRTGGLFVGGDATLTNSTVTDNQSPNGAGGIDGAYNLTLASTILAANKGPNGNVGRVTLNASNSLFGDDSEEINGIDVDNVFTDEPSLDSLTDNGCAVPAGAQGIAACVQTHSLLPGSPALDAGSNLLNLSTDQRGAGFPRALGAAADIGAFESRATTPTAIPALGPWGPWGLALGAGLLALIGWRFEGRLGRRRE